MLPACTGGGAAIAPAAPAIAAVPQSSALRTQVADGSPQFVTITGRVTEIGALPYKHVTLMTGSTSALVFTSLLASARIGDVAAAHGFFNALGNFQAANAWIVKQAPQSSPSPTPQSSPSPVPVPAISPVPVLGGGPVRLFQIFDYAMTAAQSSAAASRLGTVWGAGTGNAGATARTWAAGNPQISTVQYFVQGTDHTAISHHDLAWFEANHPDWIVYDCDAANAPTHTVAYQPGLPTDVPLDISNPDVVAYQVRTAADFAIAHGANAIGADQTLFFDYDGNQHPGWFGCGTYAKDGSFVRHWGAARGGFPNFDPKWNADVANWVRTAKSVLTGDPGLAPYHLKLVVNHPAGSVSDPNEQTILANVDGLLDETGFVSYGQYVHSSALFKVALDYMQYAQKRGTQIFEVAKFSGDQSGSYAAGGGLSESQIAYALGTYLIGNEGRASLFITPGAYGNSFAYPQVAAVNSRLGTACAAYTTDGRTYERRYTRGLVVVNSDPTSSAGVSLAHRYSDLSGRGVGKNLTVAPAAAAVLFTAENGCL